MRSLPLASARSDPARCPERSCPLGLCGNAYGGAESAQNAARRAVPRWLQGGVPLLPAHLRGRMRAACKALRPMHSGSWGAFWLLCACGASPVLIGSGWHRCLCLEFARALAASACDAAQRVRGSRCRGVCPLWTCAISEMGRNPESGSGIRSSDLPPRVSAVSEHVPSLNSVGIQNPNPESGVRIT